MSDDEATLDDVADAVRDADDQTVWSAFGQDVQQRVADRYTDDATAVVMSLTVSTDLFGHDGRLAIRPAITWATGDVEDATTTLEDYGDAVTVWHRSHPGVDRIRRTVADALEQADDDPDDLLTK